MNKIYEKIDDFFDTTADYTDLTFSDLSIRPLLFREAKKYISSHHYSKTMPMGVKIALGFFYNRELVTAVVYGAPVGRRVTSWLKCDNTNCLELVRLFSEDGMPKNTESYCLGKSFEYLKREYPAYKYLISYADPNAGHAGIIYQATNWYYTGTQRRLLPERRIFIDGIETHTRTLNIKHGSTSGDNLLQIYGNRLEIRDAKKKHVYLMCLGNKREKKEWYAKFNQEPYPK